MNLPFAVFVHSQIMESGSVSNFDRLAASLCLVLTDFLPYRYEENVFFFLSPLLLARRQAGENVINKPADI